MCDTFYHWESDDENGFRKLVIEPYETQFIKESEKFNLWDGEFKICNKCHRGLPRASYFFRVHPSNKTDRLHYTCKECQGTIFKWANDAQKKLIEQNKYYCVKCDTILPMNGIYFAKDKNRKNGFSVRCKKCTYYNSEYGISRHLNVLVDVKENMQICLECLVELPKTQEYYYKLDKRDSNKFEPKCKKCQGQEYGIVRWNAIMNLPEDKKFCIECLEIKDINNFYIKEKLSNKRYSRCKECHYLYCANRRHEQFQGDYTLDDWNTTLAYFNNCCAYCGSGDNLLEKDHIVPFSKGGKLLIENIVPACKTCNCSKNNRDLFTFYEYSEKFTYERLVAILNYINRFTTTSVDIL